MKWKDVRKKTRGFLSWLLCAAMVFGNLCAADGLGMSVHAAETAEMSVDETDVTEQEDVAEQNFIVEQDISVEDAYSSLMPDAVNTDGVIDADMQDGLDNADVYAENNESEDEESSETTDSTQQWEPDLLSMEKVEGTLTLGDTTDVVITGWEDADDDYRHNYGGPMQYYSFTAEQTGNYLFSFECVSKWSIGYFQYGVCDSPDLSSKINSLRWYRNSFSDDGLLRMSAGDTVYLGVGYKDTVYNGGVESPTVRLGVSKMQEESCTLSEPTVTPVPWGVDVKCDYRNNGNISSGFSVALLISDKEEDFDSYAQSCYFEYGKLKTGSESNGTVQGVVLNNSTPYSSQGTFSAYTADTVKLKSDTTYYAALVGFNRMETADYNQYNVGRLYYLPTVVKEPIQFVPGKEITESNVTIVDVGYELGYTRNVKTLVEFDNPLNEKIYNPRLLDKDGKQLCTLSERNGIYEGTYTLTENVDTVFIPAYEVREGEDGELVPKTGSEQTVKKLDNNFADKFKNIFTINSGAATASISCQFDTGYAADRYFYVRGQYQAKGSEEIKSLNTSIYSEYKNGSYSGSFNDSVLLKDLEAETEYTLTLNLYAQSSDSTPLYTKEYTFTTLESKVYTEEDFPDETFRKFIYSKIGNDAELSSANLEKLTSLYLYTSDMQSLGTDKAVRSIEGIQYLRNLTSISVDYQDIEDISPITELSSLKSADFNYNQINAIPDLSGMKVLQSLSLRNNRIPSTEFVQSKFNSTVWENIKQSISSQMGNLKLISADTYYLMSDNRAVFYFELENYRSRRFGSLKVKINGEEYPCSEPSNSGSYNVTYGGFYIETEGLEERNYEITIAYEENYGGDKLEEKVSSTLKSLDFMNLSNYTHYFDGNDVTISMGTVYLPQSSSSEKVLSVSLVDADAQDAVVGIGRSISSYERKMCYALPKVFNGNWPDKFGNTLDVYGTIYLERNGLSGNYDLLVKTSESDYRIPNFAVAESSKGIITSCGDTSYYTSQSEYYYVSVNGTGLVNDKFYPVLTALDGTVVTGEAAHVGNGVYRLKKLAGFDKVVGNYCIVDFVSVSDDYHVEWHENASCRLYINSSGSNAYITYNGKTQEYTLYTDYEVIDTVRLYQNYQDANDEKNALASAEVTVEGGKAKVDFRDEEGNFVPVPRSKYYYYKIKGETWSTTSSVSNYSGLGENYYSYVSSLARVKASKSLPVGFTVSDNTLYKDGDVLTSTLYRIDSDGKENKVDTLMLTARIDNTTAYFEGTYEFEDTLESGQYKVKLSGTAELTSYDIYVYETSNFYQTNQSLSYAFAAENADNGHVYFYVYAADAAELDIDKFELEFFDLNGKEITDIEIEEKKSFGQQSGSFRFTLSDITAKYNMLYCRVTYDGKLGISLTDPSKSYYAQKNESEQYGIADYLSGGISFSYQTGVGYCYVSSLYIDRYTVSVHDDYTGEEITSFDINGKGRVYFTKDNLMEVLQQDTNLKKLYTLTASADGKCYTTQRHVNIGYQGMEEIEETDVEPTGISLGVGNKLTMKVGTTKSLGAKLIPTGAISTISYTSSDEAVVTVNKYGTVTAVGVGTATVTATTANGKSASCKITVNEDGSSDPSEEPSENPSESSKESESPSGSSNESESSSESSKESGSNESNESESSSESSKESESTSERPSESPSESSKESESSSESSKESESSSESSKESEPSSEPTEGTGLKVTFIDGMTYTYTGSAIKPAIEVTNNGEILTEGTDYTVKYSNNIKAGATAKLTVTGKGSFTGKQDTMFTIEPKSLQDADIVANDISIAANSKASPVVLYNGMKLGAKDYTLSDTGKIAADKKLTIEGKGNYKDSIEIDVKVVEKLGKFKVNMKKEKFTYDGNEHKLGFEVIDSKTKEPLKEDEYMAVYSEDVISAGTVKVTIIGLGTYSGSVTKSYKIAPAKEDMTLEFDKTKEYTFNSVGTTVDDIVVKVKGSGKELEYGRDYKISYSANKKVGTGRISVTFLGNYKGSKTVKDTFTIKAAALNDDTVNVIVPDKAYTGKKNAYKSTPIVTDKSGNTLKRSDYTVNYYNSSDMTDANEIKGKNNLIELAEGDDSATVYVKVSGKGNYAGESSAYAQGEYNVKRTKDNVLDLSKAKVTFKNGGTTVKKLEYTGLLLEPDVEVTVKVKGAGTITLDSSQYDVVWTNNVNKGKATVVITGNGTPVNSYAFVGSKNATISITAGNVKNVKNLFGGNAANLLKSIYN